MKKIFTNPELEIISFATEVVMDENDDSIVVENPDEGEPDAGDNGMGWG